MANKKLINPKGLQFLLKRKNKNKQKKRTAFSRKVTDRTISEGNKWSRQQLAKHVKSHRIPQWQEVETTQYKKVTGQGGWGWGWD